MSEAAKILVIDDSEDDRLLYKRCLLKSGGGAHVVCEAGNGEDGLAWIDREVFACVLLDYSLPGRNGLEVLKRIRVKHPFVPVVMLTGLGNEKVAVTAMQEGAQNYISKSGIDAAALAHVIQGAIQHCRMQSRISEQRESLEVFARALAHDMKEPVRTIQTLLELMSAETAFDQSTNERFQSIRRAAERMTGLIDTVYIYTRLDGAEKTTLELCDAGELVEAAKRNIDHMILKRGATIACPALPQILINRLQAIQLFQSLLCNAIQHGAIAPQIDIDAVEISECWRFRVTDNGPGVSAEDVAKLFKPFKRLSHTDVQGPGLGLATCKKIMELHGGRIWYEVKSGGGAEFIFTVPKAGAPDVVRPFGLSTAPTKSDTGGAGRQIATIMLVDDDEMALELTQIQLIDGHRLQCQVLAARDGREALMRLREERVDLVLLDINMPRMDGFELLERMRAERMLDRVAVIMCSTSTYGEDIARASDLGACGYLTKPPDFERLKSILKRSTSLEIEERKDAVVLLRAA